MMRPKAKLSLLILAFAWLAPSFAAPSGPPSEFGIDAPELARLGNSAVGVRTLALVQRKQEDVLSFADGSFRKADRPLTADLWYPATVTEGGRRETYTASLPSELPAPPANFTVPGIAVRDAPPAGRG